MIRSALTLMIMVIMQVWGNKSDNKSVYYETLLGFPTLYDRE